MSMLFGLFLVGFVIAIPILFIMIIVKAIRRKKVKKTAWIMLACFVGVIVSSVLVSETDPQNNCEHEFTLVESKEATCLTEGYITQVCLKCEKETKEMIPELTHDWQEADCVSPKTCLLCGETEGDSGGHKWTDATCLLAKTCLSCGLIEGEPLSTTNNHVWIEATCKEPKTCSICGEKEGTVLEHLLDDWVIVDEGTSKKKGLKQQKCLLCNEIINSKEFNPPQKIAVETVEEVIEKSSAEHDSIEATVSEEDGSILITGLILCKNDEKEVKTVLSNISEELKTLEVMPVCLFAIGDKKDGKDGECLATAMIDSEGNQTITPMSVNFKTERNEWIRSQFSAWDGSHTVLKGLIKDNLNDEGSFKHINTTYIDILSEDKKKEVNNILAGTRYKQRVDVGDLFIMTEFSAKNAFNATIKNTAYGIVDQSDNRVILVGIE